MPLACGVSKPGIMMLKKTLLSIATSMYPEGMVNVTEWCQADMSAATKGARKLPQFGVDMAYVSKFLSLMTGRVDAADAVGKNDVVVFDVIGIEAMNFGRGGVSFFEGQSMETLHAKITGDWGIEKLQVSEDPEERSQELRKILAAGFSSMRANESPPHFQGLPVSEEVI